jgi:hypothetical protein
MGDRIQISTKQPKYLHRLVGVSRRGLGRSTHHPLRLGVQSATIAEYPALKSKKETHSRVQVREKFIK